MRLESANEKSRIARRREAVRVARRIVLSARRAVGLVPASGPGPLTEIAADLAGAIHETTDGNVALITAAGEGREGAVWVTDGLCRITPPVAAPSVWQVDVLREVLAGAAGGFPHVMVDLSGFASRGDHVAAMRAVQGVLVVARARGEREDDLLRWRDEIPEELAMGVLLCE
jgi:hypothetical protein